MGNKKKLMIIGTFYGICILLLLFREFFGIDIEDEVYHVSSIFQVLQGKIPLMSIWDGHTGFFLLSVFGALYKIIVPNLDGVVLYFRIIGLLIALLSTFLLCKILNKKYNDKNLFVYIIPMILISPILKISYNSASTILLCIICALLYTSINKTKEILRYLIIGVLSGIMCLNYPTFSIIAIFLAGYILWKNKKFKLERFLSYAGGVAIVGISFFIWIFANGSLNEFFTAIQAVTHAPHTEYRGPLNADFFYRTYIVSIIKFFVRKKYIVVLITYIISLFVLSRKVSDKNKEKTFFIAYAIYCLISTIANASGYGYFIFGISIGFLILMTFLNKKIKYLKKYAIFFIIELLYILIYSLTSDNKNVLLGVSATSTFIAMTICIMLYEYICILKEKTGEENKWHYILVIFALIISGLTYTFINVYGDSSFIKNKLNSQVSTGVHKWQFTTNERKEYLEGLEEFVDKNIKEDEKVCVATLEPMVYIMTPAEIYTPWTFDAQYLFKGFFSAKPLLDYFEKYNQLPDYIFATDYHNKDFYMNEKYEINTLIKEKYELKDSQNIGETNAWIWKLKEGENYNE